MSQSQPKKVSQLSPNHADREPVETAPQALPAGETQASPSAKPDVLRSMTPVWTTVRDSVEGRPARAAALGAILGGTLASLISTEKGRSFLRVAFGVVKPLLADSARELVTKNTANAVEQALK